MIRAILFDLGDTLESNGQLLPGVLETLEGLSVPSPTGSPLKLGLVSDYTMPPAGAPPATVAALFREYVDIVRDLGLLRFFDPPEEHMTLSTQAGVRKPDPRIFALALERLGLDGALRQAIFITEDVEHVRAATQLGMIGVAYGAPSGIEAWSSALPTIRALLKRNAID